MYRFVILTAAAASLAACDGKDATSVSITGDNGSAGIDAGGTAKIDVPGFKGEIKLPKFQVDAADLDLNGVKLFPGSTVKGINVDATEADGKQSGKVRLSFESPAGPGAVRDYFRRELGKAGFTVTDDGSGLAGTTDEQEPFRLTLGDAPGGKAKGEIAMGS